VPIVLFGFGLRLIQLGAQSLWYDETVSVYLAGQSLSDLLAHTARDIHPPAYYVLLRAFLVPAGFAEGVADPTTHRLEFFAAFLSLALGVLLIPLVYLLGRRLYDQATAIVAALLVAVSPFHVWYSQEVRMYTLGAVLGVLCLLAALRFLSHPRGSSASPGVQRGDMSGRLGRLLAKNWQPLLVYALSATLGLYSLYYFAFLLVALNIWMLLSLTLRWERATGEAADGPVIDGSRWPSVLVWTAVQILVLVLYAPWIPIAWRQAVDPPVPPWRSFVGIWPMLVETWNALCFGQSSHWRDTWPLLILLLGLVVYGATRRSRSARPLSHPSVPLLVHSFGSMALVIMLSLVVPLYHVRYAFTYAAPFAVLIAAGLVRLTINQHSRRYLAPAALGAIVLASGISLWELWSDQAYAADDHRSAVSYLEEQWRPGDAVLVNAGYAYAALSTYWHGPDGSRVRISDYDPTLHSDNDLLILQTGHVGGDAGLGWGDPRSDFYALPLSQARDTVSTLLSNRSRIWHYRIYDTVNDPDGRLREFLSNDATLFEESRFSGTANLLVQGFLSDVHPTVIPDGAAMADVGDGLRAHIPACCVAVEAGATVYAEMYWNVVSDVEVNLATSIRLVDAAGRIWSQPSDRKPLGDLLRTSQWMEGNLLPDTQRLPIPPDTPPGEYGVELVTYDPATGHPLDVVCGESDGLLRCLDAGRLRLGTVQVFLPAESVAFPSAPLARFDYIELLSADSPAISVRPGDVVPVELRWMAEEADYTDDYLVILEVVDDRGQVISTDSGRPADGQYPTSVWKAGYVVRDLREIAVPRDAQDGRGTLSVGIQRVTDGLRLSARSGLLGLRRLDSLPIHEFTIAR